MTANAYYAVGIINSDGVGPAGFKYGSAGLTRRLLRAFKTGIGAPEDAKCPSLAKDIKAVTAEAAPLRAEVASLKSEIASLKSEIAGWQKDLSEGAPNKGPINAQIKINQAKLATAQAKLAAAQTKLKPVEDKLNALVEDAEGRVCEL